MKFKIAKLLAEENINNIEDKINIIIKTNKAEKIIDEDIKIIKTAIKNNYKLSWKKLKSNSYFQIVSEFWNLKEDCQKILNYWNSLTELGKLKIRKFYPLKYSDNSLNISLKVIKRYKELYHKLKTLQSLIKQNPQLGLKIPSIEFKIPLREDIDDKDKKAFKANKTI